MANLRKEARGRECQVEIGTERWRPVIRFEGLYEVSNYGRVRSISRWVSIGKGKRLVEGRVLTHKLSNGYPTVTLCAGNFEIKKHVHRILAEAFIPGTGDVVRHLDGDRENYSLVNLAWGSYSDNERDKKEHGRSLQGERHHQAKLTEEKVRAIREMYARGITQLIIAKSIGVGRGAVGCVVRGETWRHVK